MDFQFFFSSLLLLLLLSLFSCLFLLLMMTTALPFVAFSFSLRAYSFFPQSNSSVCFQTFFLFFQPPPLSLFLSFFLSFILFSFSLKYSSSRPLVESNLISSSEGERRKKKKEKRKREKSFQRVKHFLLLLLPSLRQSFVSITHKDRIVLDIICRVRDNFSLFSLNPKSITDRRRLINNFNLISD